MLQLNRGSDNIKMILISIFQPVFPEPERYPQAEPSYVSKAIVEDPYSGRDDPYIRRSGREDPYSRSQRRDDFRPPSPAVGGRYNE